MTDYDTFRRANAKLTWDNVSWQVVLRRLLGWLYRFLPDAAKELGRHGRNTSRRLGRGLPGQLADMIMLANRGGVTSKEYYQYGLARFGGSEKLRDFVTHHFYCMPAMACARRRLRRFADQPDLKDKVNFEKYCAALDAPSASTLAVIDGDKVTDIHGAHCGEDFGDCDLFIKPRAGYQGRGTLRFESLGNGVYRAADGTALPVTALLSHLSELSRELNQDLLLQQALRNSSYVEALVGRALATMRVITVMNETDEPEVVYAALRSAGSADSIVDNYHAHGIAFRLNIETGELGAGRRLLFSADPQFYQAHPVTGAQMAGRRLAGWPDTKSLAVRLHRGSPHLLIAGWDVAMTEDGPVVLEVNIPPGLPIVQMERGFLETRYSSLLAKHIVDWLDDDGEIRPAAVQSEAGTDQREESSLAEGR
jgi:hypothetical protein